MFEIFENSLAKALLKGSFPSSSPFSDLGPIPTFLEAVDPFRAPEYTFPKKVEGEFYEGGKDENGLFHGEGTFYRARFFPGGILYKGKGYRGSYVHGKREGHGHYEEYDNEDLEVYDGEWKDDDYEGEGVLRIWDKDHKGFKVYKGTWKNGKLNGKGASLEIYLGHTYSRYDLQYGDFLDGRLHGDGITYRVKPHPTLKDAVIIRERATYDNGVPIGEVEVTFSTGEVIYNNPVREDPEAVYRTLKGLRYKAFVPKYGRPDIDSISLVDPKDGPCLAISMEWCHDLMGPSGEFVGLFKPKKGVAPCKDMLLFADDEAPDYGIKILNVGKDYVTYKVLDPFVDANSKEPITIHPGEKKEHGTSIHETDKVYGDEVEWDFKDLLTVRCL